MTAREKIEKLTHAWYGFDVFSAVAGFVLGGIGIFSAMFSLVGLMVSLFITFWIGRSLLARSSFTRVALLVLGTLSMLLGMLSTGRLLWSFASEWSLGLLLWAGYTAVGVYMQARSINTLTDKTVKAYFG